MPQNDGLKRYLDAALALSQITRSRADELVRDLIRTGEVESNQARDWVEDLVRTSRQRSEAFVSTVRGEVRRQLHDLGLTDVNDIAKRVAKILDKAESAARRAGATAKKTAAKKAPAKKAPAKKAPAKKTAATAKKASGTKKAAASATKKKATGATSAARRRT